MLINLRHIVEWLLSALLSIFAGVLMYLKILTGIMFADMILGILAAIKKKEKLSLVAMLPTLLKMAAICVVLPAVYNYETVFEITTDHKATFLLAAVIGAVQLGSMDKHFQLLFGFSFWGFLTERFPILESFMPKKNTQNQESNESKSQN
jgi:chromate transport protein ChrA